MAILGTSLINFERGRKENKPKELSATSPKLQECLKSSSKLTNSISAISRRRPRRKEPDSMAGANSIFRDGATVARRGNSSDEAHIESIIYNGDGLLFPYQEVPWAGYQGICPRDNPSPHSD